jgi:uncharacterized membrane protein
MKKQNKLDIKRIIILTAITILLLVAIFSIKSYFTGKAIKEQKEQEEYSIWLAENCECLERNYFICEEGFKYDGKFCVKENYFTYASKKCSKYDCNGEINLLNMETLKWQKEN